MHSWTRGALFAILSIILLLTVSSTSAQTQWEQFTHPTMGFSLSFPDGWTTHTSNNPSIPLILSGPSSAGVPEVPLVIAVISAPAPPNAKPEHLLAASDESLRKEAGDYHVLRVDRTMLQGRPTVVIYLTGKSNGGRDIYGLSLFTIVKPRLWVVVGLTSLHSPELASETQLLQSILVTFRPK